MISKCVLKLSKNGFSKNFSYVKFNSLCYKILATNQRRQFGSSSKQTPVQLLVESHGEPDHVVKKVPLIIPEVLEDRQVLAKVLASPINPADINTIHGSYAGKQIVPFVPGNEAVLEILDVGKNVGTLKVGDRVIPRRINMGTYRTAIVEEERNFIKIPSDIDIIAAATIAVNPCTAYRMIHDFVPLNSGNVLIQNLANSAVGQAVIQIAADKGIRTINIVRERMDFGELRSYLTSLGASLVLQISDILQSKDLINQFPKPLLGFNGVCGKDAAEMIRLMADGGTIVTYGGMARQPLIVPVGSLIFNDLNFRGFWITKWSQLHESDPKREAMLEYLFDLIRRKKLLTPPCESVPFEDYKHAFKKSMPSTGLAGKKQILVFD